MPAPRRKKGGNKPPPSRKAPNQEEDEDNAIGNMVDADDYMMADESAEQAIKQQNEEYKNKVREFYVSRKQVEQSDNGTVECRVHLLANLAFRDGDNFPNIIAAPRIQIPEGKGYQIYTSPTNGDCAFRQAGLNPTIRPCFLLMDHRKYKSQGKIYTDDIKQFNPPGKGIAMMKAAIRDLCENLGIDYDDPEEVNAKLDVRDVELRITKLGTGKGSGWAFSFVTRRTPLNDDQIERVGKFFDSEDGGYPTRKEYLKRMKGILRPSDRFLISKGGVYVKPTTDKNAGGSDNEADIPY